MYNKIFTIIILMMTLSTQASGLSFLKENGGKSFDDPSISEPLSVEEALPFELIQKDDNNFEFLFDVKQGHYIYKDKIIIKLNEKIIDIDLPSGEIVNDEYFGRVEILRYGFLRHYNATNKIKTYNFNITYQGCSELLKICYPPVVKDLKFENVNFKEDKQLVEIAKSEKKESSVENKPSISISELANSNNISIITNYLNENKGSVGVLFVFILIGVLVAFTPCIYPMMPIIIASTSKSKNKLVSSIFYAIGIALAYGLIGLLVGISNINVQFVFQNEIFVYAVSLFLVLSAFYLLGFFNLIFSSNINGKINDKIMSINPDSYLNQITIGFLSSLLLSPCSIAPLLGVLVFISQMDSTFYGTTLLVCMGFGIGMPLIILSTSFNKFMPKNGAWLEEVKNIMVIIILFVAIYLSDRNIGEYASYFLYSTVIFVYGMKLVGFTNKQKVGLIFMLLPFLLLLSNVIKDDSKVENFNEDLNVTYIKNNVELELLIKNETKPIFVDFYADWCITCVKLENEVLNKPEIIKYLNKNYLVLKIDLSKISTQEQAIMDKRKILGIPYYLFINKEKESSVFTGELYYDTFLNIMKKNNEAKND